MKCKLSMKDFVRNTILPVNNRQMVYMLAAKGIINILEDNKKKFVEVDQKYLKENIEIGDNVKTNRVKRNKKSIIILPSMFIDLLLTMAKRKNIKVEDYLNQIVAKLGCINDIFTNEIKFEKFQIKIDDETVKICKKIYDYLDEIKSKNNHSRKQKMRLGNTLLVFSMAIMFELFSQLYPEVIFDKNYKQNNQISQN